jgi:aminopeptidase C
MVIMPLKRNPTVSPDKLAELNKRKTYAEMDLKDIARLIKKPGSDEPLYSISMLSTILRGDCGCPPDVLREIERAIAKGEKVKRYAQKVGV